MEYFVPLASRDGGISAVLDAPAEPAWGIVLAHGAGADMRHEFMEGVAERLVARGAAVFRYRFPYMEAGRKAPDKPALLVETVAAAVTVAREALPETPLFLGGKSLGGRMSAQAAADAPAAETRGLIFFGFPLHPAGKPATDRAETVEACPLPMLFLQGTRDRLADIELVREVVGRVSQRASLHEIEEADHGFHVPKRTGRSHEDVLDELADVADAWARRRIS